MWFLTMLAGLADAPAVSRRGLRLLLVAGLAVFVAIGFLGFATTGTFLGYPPDYAKLLILTIEVPLTLSIAGMLGLLMAGPPRRRIER
jgi:hypothetical protein